MVKPKKRIKIRSVGKQSKQFAKLSKKLDGLVAGMEADEQRRSKQLEATILVLERQLEEEKREWAIMAKKGRKEFIMEHTFQKVLDMEDGDTIYGEEETHFGIKWKMYIVREENWFEVYLEFENPYSKDSWSMELEEEVSIVVNGSVLKARRCDHSLYEAGDCVAGLGELMKWDEFKSSLTGGTEHPFERPFTVSYLVNILKTKGMTKYAEHIPNLTDVVLNVRGTKFHVSRQCLANHSDFFKSLFYNNHSEKGKSEVPLEGIDPRDFQNFLDVVYGEQAIKEKNYEGILVIADSFLADKTIAHCEQFLIYKGSETLRRKFSLAVEFKMNELALHCISEVKDMKELREMVRDYIKTDEVWISEEDEKMKAIKIEKIVYMQLVKKMMELNK